MTQVLSIRLQDDQVRRLKNFARRSGKSQSETAAQYIEEGMRENEYTNIEFRDSTIGRLAYMRDSNLAVWEVILIAKDHSMNTERLSTYFRRPNSWVNSAIYYYQSFSTEIDQIIADCQAMTFDKLKRLLPGLETSDNSVVTS